MGMLIIVLALVVVALIFSGKPEELVPVEWSDVVVRKGYCWMPREKLHGHSMTMTEHQACFKQWYRRETDHGPVFFCIHEDGSRWEIRAFVENQQDWDRQNKEWYLQTYYILEKSGYYYL